MSKTLHQISSCKQTESITHLFPDGAYCFPHISDTNSVSSIASSGNSFALMLTLALGALKLSLDECTEFTILGLMITVVQGLLSFHHLVKPGHFFLQHLQQQQ
jgi:hypothetical protein